MNQSNQQQHAQQLLAKLQAIAQLNRQLRLKREQLNRTVTKASR
jgi:DNA-binding phage protein